MDDAFRRVTKFQPEIIEEMLSLKYLSNFSRNISKSAALFRIGGTHYKLTDMEKRMMVWSGKFKSLAECPSEVTHEVFQKAKNKARIKLANWMMAGTLLGCVAMIISGKGAKERGESVHSMNLAWHDAYNKEQEEKNKK